VKRIQNHKVKVKRRAGVGAPANTIFSFFQVKLQVNGWVGFNSSSLHSPSRFMVFAERGRKAAEWSEPSFQPKAKLAGRLWLAVSRPLAF